MIKITGENPNFEESPFEQEKPRSGRLGAMDTTMDMFMKMADGNPGGLTVMMNMVKKEDWKSPYGNGLVFIMHFDDWGIYGPSIWCLWKDCCDQDWVKFETAIVNRIKGHISLKDFQEHIGDGRRHGVPFENLQSIEEMFPPEAAEAEPTND
jgi:hypothetical protein